MQSSFRLKEQVNEMCLIIIISSKMTSYLSTQTPPGSVPSGRHLTRGREKQSRQKGRGGLDCWNIYKLLFIMKKETPVNFLFFIYIQKTDKMRKTDTWFISHFSPNNQNNWRKKNIHRIYLLGFITKLKSGLTPLVKFFTFLTNSAKRVLRYMY